MTEYLSCVAKEGSADGYFLETFVASMLSEIDGIFEPYFIPDYNKFISIFPNKKDICSLMYALDYYHDKIMDIDDDTSDDIIDTIANSVKSVIDNLIDIELSFDKVVADRKIYSDKFMDLILDENIDSVVGDVYSEYADYAYYAIKKRVLRRGK